MSVFERYLSLWVAICMAAGLVLGKAAPGATQALRDMEFGAGSQVNIPIAVLIWLMIIPMMMRVDFAAVRDRELAGEAVLHGADRVGVLSGAVLGLDHAC
jgi:ACR3 family arsenite transporter